MFLQEIEDNELIEKHSVAYSSSHYLCLKNVSLCKDISHQQFCVLPRQNFTCLVVFGHVLQEGEESWSQSPWFIGMFCLAEILKRLRAFFEFKLIDEMILS